MRKSARQQQEHRRPAALVCLVALLLLNAISVAHTHPHHPATACPNLAFAPAPQADHCVACEMLANGTGSTTMTPVFVLTECRSIAFEIHSTASALRFATILTTSPRAPPIG